MANCSEQLRPTRCVVFCGNLHPCVLRNFSADRAGGRRDRSGRDGMGDPVAASYVRLRILFSLNILIRRKIAKVRASKRLGEMANIDGDTDRSGAAKRRGEPAGTLALPGWHGGRIATILDGGLVGLGTVR
jgi:hypothetical protein